MTALDVTFNYSGELGVEQMRALNDAYEVYGIRRIDIDEAAHTITIEYDATRMNDASVAAMLRRSRIVLGSRVEKLKPLPPPPPPPAPGEAPGAPSAVPAGEKKA